MLGLLSRHLYPEENVLMWVGVLAATHPPPCFFLPGCGGAKTVLLSGGSRINRWRYNATSVPISAFIGHWPHRNNMSLMMHARCCQMMILPPTCVLKPPSQECVTALLLVTLGKKRMGLK